MRDKHPASGVPPPSDSRPEKISHIKTQQRREDMMEVLLSQVREGRCGEGKDC